MHQLDRIYAQEPKSQVVCCGAHDHTVRSKHLNLERPSGQHFPNNQRKACLDDPKR